jgi:heme o synthase
MMSADLMINFGIRIKFKMNLIRNKSLALIKLTKPIITLSVAFSALTAYILHQKSFSKGWLIMYTGVLLIAAGSSAINQIQESRMDRLMSRTKSRPIPAGKITVSWAWLWALLLSFSGVVVLFTGTNYLASSLAIFTLFWYNLIYTPLKRISPWAIIPGAIVGAIPPAIGWVAAGGRITDHEILILMLFFFTGQIPHFWLILLRHGDDYEKGGFPSIRMFFSSSQIAFLTFVWTFATASMAVSLPLFGIMNKPLIVGAVYVISLALIVFFIQWLIKPHHFNKIFMIMNIYFLLIMIAIIADSLLY